MVDLDAFNEPLPIMEDPPSAAEKRKYFGPKLFKNNKELFQNYMWNTPFLDEAALYLLIGQLEHVKNIRYEVHGRQYDFRSHVSIFQPSGSGKAGLFNYVGGICADLNMRYHVTGSVTDTALIGGIEWQDIYNKETQQYVKEKVENPGLLSPDRDPRVRILAMNETDILFDSKKTDWAKDLMTWYQKAMNVIGTPDNVLSKDTGGVNISFNCDVSLLFISKLPENFYKTITSTGFLQRTIVVYRTKSLEEKKEDNMTFLVGVGSGKKELDTKRNVIVQSLKAIDEFAAGVEHMDWTEDAVEYLRTDVFEMIHNPMEGMNAFTLSTITEFSSRYQELVVKLAHVHALTRLSDTVDKQDIGLAARFVGRMWKNAIYFIEDGLQQSKNEVQDWRKQVNKMINVFLEVQGEAKEQGVKSVWVPRNSLIKMLCSKKHGWGVTPATASARLEQAEEELIFVRGRSTKTDISLIKLGEIPEFK